MYCYWIVVVDEYAFNGDIIAGLETSTVPRELTELLAYRLTTSTVPRELRRDGAAGSRIAEGECGCWPKAKVACPTAAEPGAGLVKAEVAEPPYASTIRASGRQVIDGEISMFLIG